MSALRRAAGVVLAFVLAFAPCVAPAAEPSPAPRVFVKALAVDGELAEPVRVALTRHLVESLAEPGLELVSRERDASHIVHARVRVRDRDLELGLELRARASEAVLASVDERCELCGSTEAGETIASMGLSLRRRMDLALRPAPVVAVRTEPPGALVVLDGEPFGTSPVELPVVPGRHELRITKPGFISQSRSLELVEGTRESLSIGLQAVPESPRRQRPMREAIGWAALSFGTIGSAAGSTLVALHGRPIRPKCHGAAIDGDGTCRYVYGTRLTGAIVGALGLGLLVTGIALVVIERRRPSRSSAQARLGLGELGPVVRF